MIVTNTIHPVMKTYRIYFYIIILQENIKIDAKPKKFLKKKIQNKIIELLKIIVQIIDV